MASILAPIPTPVWRKSDNRVGPRDRAGTGTVGAMSVRVELDGLWERIAEFGVRAYLVTVTPEATPHVVSVVVDRVDDHLAVGAGRRTRANLGANPTLTLLWSPSADPSYSLVVDGTFVADLDGGERIAIDPTSAVLHKVAGADGDGPTCLPVS